MSEMLLQMIVQYYLSATAFAEKENLQSFSYNLSFLKYVPSLNSLITMTDEIAKLFPNLFGQPSATLVPGEGLKKDQGLRIGVVLSGGQAPGGHNVISGIFGEGFDLWALTRQSGI